MSDKKRILSGIQPTNTPHLGNFLGAMVNWKKLEEEHEAIYFVADLHSVTVKQEAAALRRNTFELFVLLLAMGIDPVRSTVFVQSHVPSHSELMWLLCCYAQYGELSRMTQFKDKAEKHPENINAGLFAYPVLMAADILAYGSELVPVGQDQKQHLEIARNIAQRFNHTHGDVLIMPEPYITKETARISSLCDPSKKMSKSDENPGGAVSVLDTRDIIIKKFKRAVTDSEAVVCYREGDEAKSGINNLMTIYAAAAGKTMIEIEEEFDGKGYGDFKLAVGESVADLLAPVQAEFARLAADKDYITSCMRQGAEKAYNLSRRTLRKVQKKIGLYQM